MSHFRGLLALSPLVVFLCVYLLASIYLNDFYKVPITVAFLVSSVYAVAVSGGMTLHQRVECFSRGAGNKNIMLMIWIFIMAGAFASSAKAMGAVDATVNATLHILPQSMLLPGLFVASCFISLSVGTSVGTIAALTPVAVGIASQTGTCLPMVVAIVVGGSFFGDNLSFISDTTIVATQTMGCKMSDKFRANLRIALPAAVIAAACYTYIGSDLQMPSSLGQVQFLKVLPYIAVLAAAVAGVDVMVVLCLGIILSGIVGLSTGSYDFFGWLASMGDGILGMSELIIVTLLAGGMLQMIKQNGGIDYLVTGLSDMVKTKRGGKLAIAFLVVLSDLCTANNTVAIVTVGPIARQLADRYDVDKKQAASLLDTFSCFAQGLIPYGAQVLIAAGLAQIAPNSLFTYMYYPFLLGIVALLNAILKK